MAHVGDSLYEEKNKPIVMIQSHFNLEELFRLLEFGDDSAFELTFKLVLFFNSFASVKGGKKKAAVVPLRSIDRRVFCSAKFLRLMGMFKASDYMARRLFSLQQSVCMHDIGMTYAYFEKLGEALSKYE